MLSVDQFSDLKLTEEAIKAMEGLLKIISNTIRANPYSLPPEIRTAMVGALSGALYKEIIKSVCT